MPDEANWVTLYNPSQQATHRVPDLPGVVKDFRDRGWETPDDTTARVESEASELRGKALDDALEDAGLSKSGTVADKQQRLADHEAEQHEADLAEGNTTTTEEGSE